MKTGFPPCVPSSGQQVALWRQRDSRCWEQRDRSERVDYVMQPVCLHRVQYKASLPLPLARQRWSGLQENKEKAVRWNFQHTHHMCDISRRWFDSMIITVVLAINKRPRSTLQWLREVPEYGQELEHAVVTLVIFIISLFIMFSNFPRSLNAAPLSVLH